MKLIKIFLPIFLLLLFIPFIASAESCNADKISINSIELSKKVGGVIENNNATVQGRDIGLDLKMFNVGDIVRYKIEIKNDSTEDYEINNYLLDINSQFINYSFESEDDSNIVKANSSKTVYLKIEYKNAVPDDMFVSNSYKDDKDMMIQLSTDDLINIPDTVRNQSIKLILLVVSLIIVLVIGIVFYVRKKRFSKMMLLLIGLLIVIPIRTFALCKCEININSKVVIKKDFGLKCYGDIVIEYLEGEERYYLRDEYKYYPVYEDENRENQIGWIVNYNNSHNTEDIDAEICSYVNDIPITSTARMYQYSQANRVNLSNFNTAHVTDMSSMFTRTHFTNLDLSGFDTSSVKDMSYMFAEVNVDSLDLSSFDTSNVEDMHYMFYQTNANSIDLSSFDTKKLKNMDGMFDGITLTSLDITHFDTSNVTSMDSLFEDTLFTSIDLSNFNTKKVTNMTRMFYNSKIETLNLSNFDTSSVVYMKEMFSNTAATSINVSSFDTSNVTKMDGMFSNSNVTELDLTNFDTHNVTTMEHMFTKSKIEVLDLSSFDISSLQNNNRLFNYCVATVGYAKDQATADYFNSASGKPSTLTFVVKGD